MSLMSGKNTRISVLSSGEPTFKWNARVIIQNKGGVCKKLFSLHRKFCLVLSVTVSWKV
jgi:hypothetical protein